MWNAVCGIVPASGQPGAEIAQLMLLYNILFFLLGLLALPVFLRKKYRHSFKQKLGFLPRGTFDVCSGKPRIWVNAVSVGEVVGVSSVVKALKRTYPDSCIIISTGTETGQKMAHQLIKEASCFIYFPLDIPWVVKKMLQAIQPDLFITAETEIWPNFLYYAKKMGVKTMLVNGRISRRSIGKYYRARFFFRKVLHNFDCLSMASEIDSERIKLIGAPEERVFISGNSKFDTLSSGISPVYEKEMRRKLNIGEENVFIAASIHPGEDELIISSYKRLLQEFPELIFIIVPRHIERTSDIEKVLKSHGFNSYYLYSEKFPRERTKPVIIVNTIGELFKIYSVGTIVFCGGSLVPKGGQNILEPAAWGKVVLYGPSMEDFLEGRKLLEHAGAGFVVRSVDEIVNISSRFLKDPQERKLRGEAGREAILKRGGAASKNADLVKYLIENASSPRYNNNSG